MNRNFSRSRKREGGFSLIEVTIAMAIAAVALVTLLGLIPQGMDTMREAGDQAIEGRIHQQLLNELQMTPFQNLDEYNEQEFFYDSQGEELGNTMKGDKKGERGSLAHIYSARVTIMGKGPNGTAESVGAPASIGGANFQGYSFGEGDLNPLVRPVIVEVAAVAGLDGGEDDKFEWDLPENHHLVSTYQSMVVEMGQDLR